MESNAQSSSAVVRLTAASNDLGFKLLPELIEREVNSNILISPSGLAFALFMLYNGAGGNTRQALCEVFAMHGLTDEEINDACLVLRTSLLSQTDDTVIKIANALWVNAGLRFNDFFVQTIKQFHAAEARALNFNDPTAVTAINEWVQEQTGGKIQVLLERDDVSSSTDCILSSAVYFKGLWATPFPKESTREEPFHVLSGQPRNVPMMQRSGRYQYYRSDEFQVIRLPYDGDRLSMYILLPAEHSSPTELSSRMNSQRWEEWLARMKEESLVLSLPRFELTYEAEMSGPLTALGLGILFGTEADFSPMGLGGHYVEKLKHKSRTEVNEEGTEAAAVSAILMGRSLRRPRKVAVNRPFFWAIRDDVSRTLIFVGLVIEPGS